MNQRIVSIFVFIISAFMLLTGPSIVFAKSDIVPGGPWLSDNQNVNLSRLSSYEELVKRLHQIEKSSKGLIDLDEIGYTNYGKALYLAKVGDPTKTPVMIMTQQHGNEPMTTEAALKLLKELGTGSKNVQGILDELFVLMIIRVNPEGAELYTRGNADFNAPPRDSRSCFLADGTVDNTKTNQGRGVYSTTYVDPDGIFLSNYDINRYHWPDWSQSDQIRCNPDIFTMNGDPNFDPDQNPVPEAVAVLNAFQAYGPIWMADFHHQGTYVTDDGENITSSILWPTNTDVLPAPLKLSQQLCVQINDHMQQFGFATITLYPGGSFPGIARNAYGLAGAGSILVELKGGIGQKQSGMIIKHAYEQMWTILETTADGSLFGIDETRVDEIEDSRTFYYKQIPPEHNSDDGE